MSSTPVSIVIAGAGLIGQRHAKHVVDEPETNLTAIVDPTTAGSTLATRYGVLYFPDLESALASRDVNFDAVILATPTHTHVPLALLLLAVDKHVLVEKPIAEDLDIAKELVDRAQTSNAKILVGHHRRFNPYIVRLKKALDEDALGRLIGVSGVWTCLKPTSYYDVDWRRSSKGGGVLAINLIHDIDLLRYLLGNIVRVYAEEGTRTRRFEVEETGAVTFTFSSGAVGTFFFSDATPSPLSFEGTTGENPDLIGYYGRNSYTIFGSRACIQFPELQRHSFDHLPVDTEKGWLERLSTTREYAEVDDTVQPLALQLKHFVDVCRGKVEASCSAEEAYKSLTVLQAVKASLQSHIPVTL